MRDECQVIKALNNNVVVASNAEGNELILIGKGIGFGRKKEDIIDLKKADKLYVLYNPTIQNQYLRLLGEIDEAFIPIMNDLIDYSEHALNTTFGEQIHIALTDHLSFAVKRLQQGMDIIFPFDEETKIMYSEEYNVAKEVIRHLSEALGIKLPEGEIGFVALHLHSARTHRSISEINKSSQLVHRLLDLIEQELNTVLDKQSVDFLQLVQHLRNTIKRIEQGESTDSQEKLINLLKTEYPLCYNLSRKLIKVMEENLNHSISDGESVYLTLHLHRLTA